MLQVYNFGGNFLLTLANLTTQSVDHYLELLGRNDSMRQDGIKDPFDVNAYYTFADNFIDVNPGILHYPYISERIQ
ncbi:hypothetical protein C0J52_24911 [Blattella germanica]|nr:hypothetical protein C0J52_24911 [Blattella germanica]